MRRFLLTTILPALAAVAFFASAGNLPAADAHPEGGAAAGVHEEHPEGVPLDFKKDLAIWSLVTFAVFVFVLKTFAWTPLSQALNARESKVRDDIAAAEQSRIKAEQLLAEHSKKMEQVQEEIREIVAEARRDAEHTKQDILGEAQREAEATKQRAISEINRAKDGAMKELFDAMATHVASATEHVLGRSLTAADQDRLINEALAEISSSK